MCALSNLYYNHPWLYFYWGKYKKTCFQLYRKSISTSEEIFLYLLQEDFSLYLKKMCLRWEYDGVVQRARVAALGIMIQSAFIIVVVHLTIF